MTQEQVCANCENNCATKFCKYDNVAQLIKHENLETCPFWSPRAKIDKKFRSEVKRKVKDHR